MGIFYRMNKLIKPFCKNTSCLLAGLLLLTLPTITCAATQPVEKILINADRMQMDINSGKSVYTGNVKISQGGLLLTGDKVTLERNKEIIERLIITGKPATYIHVSETGETIEAQSEHMIYTSSQNKLVMTINAHLQQPDLKLSSQKIIYDTQKRIVIAGNNNETTTSTEVKPAQRVNITLTPKESTTDK